MADPKWTWCAMAGAARQTTIAVDVADFGDGYVHRATRGLNPVRPAWSLQFPFVNLAELKAMDDFLRLYAVPGFWFLPPDGALDAFATCDEWSSVIIDRSGAGAKAGTLTATFTQAFNPQNA